MPSDTAVGVDVELAAARRTPRAPDDPEQTVGRPDAHLVDARVGEECSTHERPFRYRGQIVAWIVSLKTARARARTTRAFRTWVEDGGAAMIDSSSDV